MDRPLIPKYGTVSQVLLQLVVVSVIWPSTEEFIAETTCMKRSHAFSTLITQGLMERLQKLRHVTSNIKTGENTPFRVSIYDKREDFAFRIVNFPHMDSNIPANPAYGVYISQLVRYGRICTSKVDFINRFRGLSLRLRQQGFETNLLQKSFNKFFGRHGLIFEKYGAALREMRLAIHYYSYG